MKRIITICLAFWMLALPVLSAKTHASWSEGLFLQNQEKLEGALLAPGTALEYPLEVTIDGNAAALTDVVLGEEKLSLAVEQGKAALSSAKLEKRDGVYALVLKTASNAGAEAQKVKLTIARTLEGKEQASCTVSFRVGWATADGALLENLGKGETIPVDQRTPAFTKAQMLGLMEKNKGEALTFAGDGWSYSVLPSAAKEVNFRYNNDAIKAIADQLDENGRQLHFVNFPAGVTLGNKGNLTLDVSGLEEFEGKFYAYRYAYGKLYSYPSAYNADGTLTIPTAVLDHYIITNIPVAEGTVITGASQGTIQPDHTEKNPDTGSRTLVGGAVMLAVVSVLSAAVFGKKKNG